MILMILAAVLAQGCITDSGDNQSLNSLDTPFTVNITGDWNFELEQDTTFRYTSSVNTEVFSDQNSDSILVRERTKFLGSASKQDSNDRKRFRVTLIFAELQPQPGTYELGSSEMESDDGSLNDNGHVRMIIENTVDKQSSNSITLQKFRWEPEEGSVTVTRYDGDRFQGSYEFIGNLSHGIEQARNKNGEIVEEIIYEDVKEAVFIEGRFDRDLTETENE